jgi:hypothetical protein
LGRPRRAGGIAARSFHHRDSGQAARLIQLRLQPLLPLPFVAGIPFAAFTILVLRHFYTLGGFWGDSGMIAFIIWHNTPWLTTARLSGGGSFLAIHTAFTLIPITWLSYILPLTKIQFFAAFCGLCHALLALASYWLLVSSYRLQSGAKLLAAVIIAILFAFNGIALAAARNPHFELLIISTGLLFLIALLQGRSRLTWLFFLLCIATREDAGLHLFALLAVTITFARLQGMPFHQQRHFLVFAFCAVGYSLAVITIQHLLFPTGGSLGNVYIGVPPFAGITWPLLLNRLGFYIFYRPYIFLPAIIGLAWAILCRNPFIIAGYIACIPWFLLHLFAASPIAGTLSNYYAYPFMFALIWPLIGLLIQSRLTGRPVPPAARPILGFSLMLAASFTGLAVQHNPGRIDLPASFYLPPSSARQQATDAALHIIANTPTFGRVLVDGSVAALDPNDYTPAQLVSSAQTKPPDMIVFFTHGYMAPQARAMAAQYRLSALYQIPNTELMIAARQK